MLSRRLISAFLLLPADLEVYHWAHVRATPCFARSPASTDFRKADMTDAEKAAKVLETLQAAEHAPAQAALPLLNDLVGLVQAHGEQPLEVEEARASAFMAVCEIGKALHRGQRTDHLWAQAIDATQRWKRLAR
jgi:hypothetical protein